MTERPILFSAPMVRALLDGLKTQTRRAIKGAPRTEINHRLIAMENGWNWQVDQDGICSSLHRDFDKPMKCPYGQPDDRLRVKEAAWMWCERQPNGTTPTGRHKWHYVPMQEAAVIYVADHPARPTVSIVSPDTGNSWGWRYKVGRFLPAWASRTLLEVTSVRVERLQNISEADAITEGIEPNWIGDLKIGPNGFGGQGWVPDCGWCHYTNSIDGEPAYTPIESYRSLWEQINGVGSWDANPWVWVVEFKHLTIPLAS